MALSNPGNHLKPVLADSQTCSAPKNGIQITLQQQPFSKIAVKMHQKQVIFAEI